MKKLMLIIIFVIVVLFTVTEIYIRYFANYNEPCFDSKSKIVKREKNTSGNYKTAYTNTGFYGINNEGWNSTREYYQKKEAKKCRIAIVGHSNVEGLRVHVNKTFSKILEDKLIEKEKNVEIYTFGFGGMHMAQALHVSRYIVNNYKPDVLIIGTLLDNFFYDAAEHHDFLSLKFNQNQTIQEIVPENMEEVNNSPLSSLYFLKTIKYADIRFHLGETILKLVGKSVIPKEKENSHYTDTVYRKQQLLAVGYLLKEFEKLQTQIPEQLIFLEFPNAVPSYCFQTQIPVQIKLYENKKVKLIRESNFLVLSLDSFFLKDYKMYNKKFDFPNDRHYNEYAHKIIGEVLSEYLVNNHLVK